MKALSDQKLPGESKEVTEINGKPAIHSKASERLGKSGNGLQYRSFWNDEKKQKKTIMCMDFKGFKIKRILDQEVSDSVTGPKV